MTKHKKKYTPVTREFVLNQLHKLKEIKTHCAERKSNYLQACSAICKKYELPTADKLKLKKTTDQIIDLNSALRGIDPAKVLKQFQHDDADFQKQINQAIKDNPSLATTKFFESNKAMQTKIYQKYWDTYGEHIMECNTKKFLEFRRTEATIQRLFLAIVNSCNAKGWRIRIKNPSQKGQKFSNTNKRSR